MAVADRAAVLAGVSSLALMEAAGTAVAEAAATLAGPGAGKTIVVACGPGNNGGDGFVAARLLAARGFAVRLGLLGSVDALKGDARAMQQRWQGRTEPLTADLIQAGDIIVDALFGAGLARPLAGDAVAAVEAINVRRKGGARVLAVDVPSGLSGSTGQAQGPVVEADETVTFFRLKPGHLLYPGRRLCGRVTLAPIPIPESVLKAIGPDTFANGPALWRPAFPSPDAEAHKYVRGHAVVVSGGPETTGAARLGARAALRVGAGLVTLIGSPAATAINAVHETAVMVRIAFGPNGVADFLADTRRNAVLIGPGAGSDETTARSVLAILASEAAVVLDADALTAFAGPSGERATAASSFGFMPRVSDIDTNPEQLFRAIGGRSAPVVLTPHEGEFRRLFPGIEGDKLARARAAARTSGAVVILKGPDTVIAHPDGRAAINANAPPWLATAGSGDVLAGLITGLLAQHMPAFESACAAVWLHGEAAQNFGRGLIAEDLPEMLPRVLQSLFEQSIPIPGGSALSD
ncbi:MAG: NAD(P)H-hydrate dehydratase [Hyphomicrobiales bacterium]|nr:MAG: NAD(P)H-hydrate dehydratase [Hyphomicrobiales bacterium]